MKDANPNPRASRTWLPFAVLELGNPAPMDALETWLAGALLPLALPGDFLSKVLASLCSAAAGAPPEASHVRFSVLVPAQAAADRHTWGFFQTVKCGDRDPGAAGCCHEITCYLYDEGGPRKAG